MARERRRSVFPGFDALADQRRQVVAELVQERQRLGLSQTEVAARMQTSQSAIARMEAGDGDLRLSTLQRYAAAVGRDLEWRLSTPRHQTAEATTRRAQRTQRTEATEGTDA